MTDALELQMFVAHDHDIYEAHWVIAESQEAAEKLLAEYREKEGFSEAERQEGYDPPDWTWQTLGPDEILTVDEGEEDDESGPVRDWIAKHGRGHLSWGEIG
jgi:hypothetical protein